MIVVSNTIMTWFVGGGGGGARSVVGISPAKAVVHRTQPKVIESTKRFIGDSPSRVGDARFLTVKLA